jgi:hypothetical protein
MVYTTDLKSVGLTVLRVRAPPRLPSYHLDEFLKQKPRLGLCQSQYYGFQKVFLRRLEPYRKVRQKRLLLQGDFTVPKAKTLGVPENILPVP